MILMDEESAGEFGMGVFKFYACSDKSKDS